MNNNTLIKTIYAVLRAANVCHTDCEGNIVPATDPSCYGTGGGATAFQCTDLAACSLSDLGTKSYNDLTDLPTIIDTTYTLVPIGTTSFNLVDNNSNVISNIAFPTGSTFACTDLNGCSLADLGTRNFSDLQGLPTLTQAGGNITGTVDLSAGTFTLTGATAGSADGVTTAGSLNTGTQAIDFTVAAPGSNFNVDLSNIEAIIDPANVNITVTGLTATTVEGALIELAGLAHVPMTTTDSNSVAFTTSGADNQNLTAIVIGSDTATNGQVAQSDGAGGINWVTPGAGHVAATFNDGNTINFTASGVDNQTVTAEIAGADTATNGQTPISDGAGGITWTTPAAGHPAVTLDAGVNPALSLVGATQVLSLNLDTAGSYDNTTSGLTATSIQDAIDEILASAKSYTLAFPDNSTIELRDEDNALVSSFTRNTFTKADTDSIVTTVTVTNQPSQSDGRNLEYKADIVVAPAQGGVPNALSVIAGQGVYVAATTALPEYDSNALAIAGGLAVGNYYQLSVNNIYGLPHGLHITVV